MKKTKLQKYENILIRFSHNEYYEDIRATIYLRTNEMIIEMEHEGWHYTIVGRLDGNVYRGKNERSGSTAIVNAKWVQLDSLFLGIWMQDGVPYNIMFKLAKTGYY